MTLVDSFGWVEYFNKGPLANKYRKYLESSKSLIVPTIVCYETYKVLSRNKGEDLAFDALAVMKQNQIVPLTLELSLEAAALSLEHKLATADSIVYASALHFNAELVTSDNHFKHLEKVVLIT